MTHGLKLGNGFQRAEALPVVLEGLDVESECGRDGVDVLAVELLQDRRLAGVVQPADLENEFIGYLRIKYFEKSIDIVRRKK